VERGKEQTNPIAITLIVLVTVAWAIVAIILHPIVRMFGRRGFIRRDGSAISIESAGAFDKAE